MSQDLSIAELCIHVNQAIGGYSMNDMKIVLTISDNISQSSLPAFNGWVIWKTKSSNVLSSQLQRRLLYFQILVTWLLLNFVHTQQLTRYV